MNWLWTVQMMIVSIVQTIIVSLWVSIFVVKYFDFKKAQAQVQEKKSEQDKSNETG